MHPPEHCGLLWELPMVILNSHTAKAIHNMFVYFHIKMLKCLYINKEKILIAVKDTVACRQEIFLGSMPISTLCVFFRYS